MPKANAPQIRVVQVEDYKKQPRRMRRPKEQFNVRGRPFELVPFMIHPVLPGETLDAAFLQSRVVSDKVASNLIGWWHEYHFFYVPIRALTQSEDYALPPEDMNKLFLDPSFSMVTGYGAGANSVPLYNFKGGIPWLQWCYTMIHDRFFTDEDDAVVQWDDYFVTQIEQQNWAHSLKEESAGTDDSELPGVDEQEELDILPGFATHYAQWELMRDEGLTDLTYRDYLKSYGISVPKDIHVDEIVGEEPALEPELLRSVRKWTYPTLAPQQGDAESTSVVFWSCAERITKRRFFGEPGFIVGVSVTRPKMYLGSQKGHFVGLLKNAYSFLPATVAHLPYTSIQEELDSATDGILQGGDEDYWLDIKDGFIHGGQFVNWSMTGHAGHLPAMPVMATLQKKYITETMMNNLFATTDGTASYLYQDGAVHLDILSKIGRDTTPGQ